jgi:hypothetical protein
MPVLTGGNFQTIVSPRVALAPIQKIGFGSGLMMRAIKNIIAFSVTWDMAKRILSEYLSKPLSAIRTLQSLSPIPTKPPASVLPNMKISITLPLQSVSKNPSSLFKQFGANSAAASPNARWAQVQTVGRVVLVLDEMNAAGIYGFWRKSFRIETKAIISAAFHDYSKKS